jgi:hypothetical protein
LDCSGSLAPRVKSGSATGKKNSNFTSKSKVDFTLYRTQVRCKPINKNPKILNVGRPYLSIEDMDRLRDILPRTYELETDTKCGMQTQYIVRINLAHKKSIGPETVDNLYSFRQIPGTVGNRSLDFEPVLNEVLFKKLTNEGHKIGELQQIL